MDPHPLTRQPRRAALALLVALGAAPTAGATDLLGLSIGAGVGQTTVNVDRVADSYPLGFSEHDHGWKGYVAMRAVKILGVEVEYVDFGHPHATIGNIRADGTVRGAAAFGMVFLPLPVVDLYAKAGFARLQSTATGVARPLPVDICFFARDAAGCPFRIDRTDTRVAYGVGVQLALTALVVRAEFERFASSVGDPNLASLSLGWRF